MSEFQRQHPVAAISRALGLIRGNLITILVFLFVGASSDEFNLLWFIGGGFGFLLVLGLANWWRFLYKIEEGELHIRSGIFVRKNLYLTKDRIQVIDITSGIIQRMFGLVKLDIQTAGSSSREAAIEAVTLERAKEINRLLRDSSDSNGNGEVEGVAGDIEQQEQEFKQEIALPGKELLIAASTSGSFGIALSILATLFSQIEPVISQSELFEYLFGLLPSQSDVLLIISVILIFVIFAWLLSFFSTLFSFGDFLLRITDKELVISRGIFEKKRITVPYNRLQAIHVAEGMIRQPLGYASLHLESAGYGDEKGTGSIVLFPLIHRKKILALLDDVFPDYTKEMEGIRPPKRSLRRYLFRSAFIVTTITAGLYWLLELNNWIWILPALSLVWGWLKYKDAAAAWGRDLLILRSRAFSKTTAYIKKNRVQDVSLSQSWIQRFRRLCTIQVHVASGDQGKSFTVRELDLDEAYLLVKELKGGVSMNELLREQEENVRWIALPGWPRQATN
ncbi:MAG: PH domain-containing protein [Balneolaceae bacterium]|nr:PH domain-containing protein [Balneolaceae bacterium]MCH8548013.1 PH domain-containing protein [Balneolaceae bacterium]